MAVVHRLEAMGIALAGGDLGGPAMADERRHRRERRRELGRSGGGERKDKDHAALLS
ncbi:MAG TPA: hypothetical protein VGC56_08970 [Allosphingosinicella sp.]